MKLDISEIRKAFPDHADEITRVLSLSPIEMNRIAHPVPLSDDEMAEYMRRCDADEIAAPVIQALAKVLDGQAVRLPNADYVHTAWSINTIGISRRTKAPFVGATSIIPYI